MRILCQKRDHKGTAVGNVHCLSALDSCIYEVRFLDGRTKELAMNSNPVCGRPYNPRMIMM